MRQDVVSPVETPAKGWLLYDGACGVCSTWVSRFKNSLARRGFTAAPLQAPWVADRLKLSGDDLLRDVRLLLVDGSQRTGADAYRHLMRQIWWTWPFYALSVIPGFNLLFDSAYRVIADNRGLISHTCRISAPPTVD